MIPSSATQQFKSRFGGTLLAPGNPEYHVARSVFNTMIDRRPALIAQCANAVDVIEAVNFAREQKLLLSVRCTGHNIGGYAVCLVRKYGLALDNLLSAEVVLADGRLVTASASQHDDLFWAIRGGGGNFGVVTNFEFRAHPVGTVLAGIVLHPAASAAGALQRCASSKPPRLRRARRAPCYSTSRTIHPDHLPSSGSRS
jgi:FAD/FMN-containing dehydrogenase